MSKNELADTLEIAINTRELDVALKMLLVMILEELRKD